MNDGIVLNICNDFLGQTLVVEYKGPISANRRILFVYAHIIPRKGLIPGCYIKRKEIIAKVCDTYRNPQLPPHLHLSCFEVLKKIQAEHLDWNLFFSENPEVNLVNPVFL